MCGLQGVRGLVMLHIMVPGYCPVKMVKHLFDKVRSTKVSYTKHVVRLIPFQYVSYPRVDDLQETLARLVTREYGAYATLYPHLYNPPPKREQPKSIADSTGDEGRATDADSAEPPTKFARPNPAVEVPVPTVENPPVEAAPSSHSCTTIPPSIIPAEPTRYSILFRARNCNVLSRQDVHGAVFKYMPGNNITRSDYKTPMDAIVVEAVKNILGVCYFPNYAAYCELNIRKFLQGLTGDEKDNNSGPRKPKKEVPVLSNEYETDSDMSDF